MINSGAIPLKQGYKDMDRQKNEALRGNEVAYFSALRLPEGKKGKFSIVHNVEKSGTELTAVSQRDALFWTIMGRKINASRIICDQDEIS